MKLVWIILAMCLVGCREEPQAEKIVVRIDEEQLAEVIAKSLLKGTARVSELGSDNQTNAIIDFPEIAELRPVEVDESGGSIVLNLDEEKLQQAIYEGMIQAASAAVKTVKIDSHVMPPVSADDTEVKEKIIVEVTSEKALYGVVEGERTLLVETLSGDDLSMARKWLKDEVSERSGTLRLHIRMANPSVFGLTRKIIRLASEEGIKQVTFVTLEE